MKTEISDVVIVGAGIVGLYVADCLSSRKDLKILLIEAGDLERSDDSLIHRDVGKSEGIKLTATYKFGGGHNVWHGLLARLSDREVEDDANLWGIAPGDFKRFYDEAERYFGLDGEAKQDILRTIHYELPKPSSSGLEFRTFFQPQLRHDPRTKFNELRMKGVRIQCGAPVCQILREGDNYLVVTRAGSYLTRRVVLAANPIQTPKILFNSNLLLDKFVRICDHPMGVIAKVKFNKKVKLPLFFIRKKFRKIYAKVGLLVRDEENSLKHTFYVVPTTESKFTSSGGSLRAELIALRDSGISLKLLIRILRSIPTILFIVAYKLGFMFRTRYADLLIVSEQDFDDKNVLDLGEPTVSKNWQVSKKLIQSIKTSVNAAAHFLDKQYGVASTNCLDDQNLDLALTSAAHLCCSLPVSNDNFFSENFQVKSAPNLYVVGSSIFPKAYSLNNTLTAVAAATAVVEHILEQ